MKLIFIKDKWSEKEIMQAKVSLTFDRWDGIEF